MRVYPHLRNKIFTLIDYQGKLTDAFLYDADDELGFTLIDAESSLPILCLNKNECSFDGDDFKKVVDYICTLIEHSIKTATFLPLKKICELSHLFPDRNFISEVRHTDKPEIIKACPFCNEHISNN